MAWFFYPQIPDISVPETNIGCDFVDTSKCQINDINRRFWVEKILSRFKEGHLRSYNFEESYRLVLLPTFDKPLIIQISRLKNEKILMTKKLSGEGGFGLAKFGKLSFDKKRILSESEWNTAIKLIDEMSFFNTSSLTDEPFIFDGSLWALEGKDGNLYHEIQRIIPDEKFGKVCSYFLKLSEVEKEYEGYL